MINGKLLKDIAAVHWDWLTRKTLEITKDIHEMLFEVTREKVFVRIKTPLHQVRYCIGDHNEDLPRGFYMVLTSRSGFGKVTNSANIGKLYELSGRKVNIKVKDKQLRIASTKMDVFKLDIYPAPDAGWKEVKFKGKLSSLGQVCALYEPSYGGKEFFQRIHFNPEDGTSITDGSSILTMNRFGVDTPVDLPLSAAFLINQLGEPLQVFVNDKGHSNWVFKDAAMICTPNGKYPDISKVIPDHRITEYQLITELDVNEVPIQKLKDMVANTKDDVLDYTAAWIIKNRYGLRLGALKGGDFINIPCKYGKEFCVCVNMEWLIAFLETERNHRLKLYGVPGSAPSKDRFLWEGQGVRWVCMPREHK